MKKFFKIAAAILLVISLLMVGGCGSQSNGGSGGANNGDEPDFGEGVKYITDEKYYDYYVAFTTNPDGYNGNKYAVDGMFHMTKYEDKEIPQLFRYHREVDPADGKEYAYYRGFMLKGDVPTDVEEKAWIRVVGTLSAEKHEDHSHVFLIVESFELLDEPGSAYVE